MSQWIRLALGAVVIALALPAHAQGAREKTKVHIAVGGKAAFFMGAAAVPIGVTAPDGNRLPVPALAAGPAKTTQAPTVKSEQAKSEQVKTKTTEQAKTGVLNANAKMGRHHHKHHRSHKHIGALKTHKFSKVSKASIKHVAPAAIKRG